jgi:hypothetical protein
MAAVAIPSKKAPATADLRYTPTMVSCFLVLRIEAAPRKFHESGIKRGTARLRRTVCQDCDWPQKMFKIIFLC